MFSKELGRQMSKCQQRPRQLLAQKQKSINEPVGPTSKLSGTKTRRSMSWNQVGLDDQWWSDSMEFFFARTTLSVNSENSYGRKQLRWTGFWGRCPACSVLGERSQIRNVTVQKWKLKKRKHSIYIHFSKDRNCDICLRTEVTKVPGRRRDSGAVPRADKFVT